MSIIKNTVLLLKSEKSDDGKDKYKEELEDNNFEVRLVKTLIFQYKNIDILREKVLKSDNYSGIILSSPRCVCGVSQALEKEKFEQLWGSKFNYTVGKTTHNEALLKLGIQCIGKESGNAKNLAAVIIQNPTKLEKPYLFPHGNLKTDTLKIELEKENLKLEEVLIYDTLPNPNIEEEIKQCTDGFTGFPEFMIFFSPSGLHSSLDYLRKVPIDLCTVKLIAIGPVTQLAIENENLPVYKVAQNPTPQEILKTLL